MKCLFSGTFSRRCQTLSVCALSQARGLMKSVLRDIRRKELMLFMPLYAVRGVKKVTCSLSHPCSVVFIYLFVLIVFVSFL